MFDNDRITEIAGRAVASGPWQGESDVECPGDCNTARKEISVQGVAADSLDHHAATSILISKWFNQICRQSISDLGQLGCHRSGPEHAYDIDRLEQT